MEMKKCATLAPHGGRCASPGSGLLRKKLLQANSAVANSTSQGTRRAKTVGGVHSRMSAPSAPPTRLMANRVRMLRPGGLLESDRPVKPVTICAGNSAMVEVMLAARASMPVSINDGSVMKEPPPASAFCAPAQIEATNRTKRAVMEEGPPFPHSSPLPHRASRDARLSTGFAGERALPFSGLREKAADQVGRMRACAGAYEQAGSTVDRASPLSS